MYVYIHIILYYTYNIIIHNIVYVLCIIYSIYIYITYYIICYVLYILYYVLSIIYHILYIIYYILYTKYYIFGYVCILWIDYNSNSSPKWRWALHRHFDASLQTPGHSHNPASAIGLRGAICQWNIDGFGSKVVSRQLVLADLRAISSRFIKILADLGVSLAHRSLPYNLDQLDPSSVGSIAGTRKLRPCLAISWSTYNVNLELMDPSPGVVT